jgi:hypothetical protein
MDLSLLSPSGILPRNLLSITNILPTTPIITKTRIRRKSGILPPMFSKEIGNKNKKNTTKTIKTINTLIEAPNNTIATEILNENVYGTGTIIPNTKEETI